VCVWCWAAGAARLWYLIHTTDGHTRAASLSAIVERANGTSVCVCVCEWVKCSSQTQSTLICCSGNTLPSHTLSLRTLVVWTCMCVKAIEDYPWCPWLPLMSPCARSSSPTSSTPPAATSASDRSTCTTPAAASTRPGHALLTRKTPAPRWDAQIATHTVIATHTHTHTHTETASVSCSSEFVISLLHKSVTLQCVFRIL